MRYGLAYNKFPLTRRCKFELRKSEEIGCGFPVRKPIFIDIFPSNFPRDFHKSQSWQLLTYSLILQTSRKFLISSDTLKFKRWWKKALQGQLFDRKMKFIKTIFLISVSDKFSQNFLNTEQQSWWIRQQVANNGRCPCQGYLDARSSFHRKNINVSGCRFFKNIFMAKKQTTHGHKNWKQG